MSIKNTSSRVLKLYEHKQKKQEHSWSHLSQKISGTTLTQAQSCPEKSVIRSANQEDERNLHARADHTSSLAILRSTTSTKATSISFHAASEIRSRPPCVARLAGGLRSEYRPTSRVSYDLTDKKESECPHCLNTCHSRHSSFLTRVAFPPTVHISLPFTRGLALDSLSLYFCPTIHRTEFRKCNQYYVSGWS